MRVIAAFLAFFVLSAAAAYAQVPPPPPLPRSITVSGEAEEQVDPDQAVLSITLSSKNASLTKAKQENDELVAKLVAIISNRNIPKEKVATSNVSVEPQYSYENGKPHLEGYAVNRSIRITIDKIDQSERVLEDIVEAKIDQVNGLEFQLANREAHMETVRVKAFDAAKAKAESLAKAAGAKLGVAMTISADDAEQRLFRPMPMMAMQKAAVASVPQELPGTITLHASVTVSFWLE